jgi:hypothetical protein
MPGIPPLNGRFSAVQRQKTPVVGLAASHHQFFAHLRLTVHERSSTVYPVTNDIPYLGFVTYPSHRLLKRRNGIAIARRFRQQIRQLAAGTLDYADIARAARGWLAHAAHGDTCGLQRVLVTKYVISRRATWNNRPFLPGPTTS